MLKFITKRHNILKLMAIFSITLFIISCTTQDFETPKTKTVYRIKLKNLGNDNYKYRTVGYFYYRRDGESVKEQIKNVPVVAVVHPGSPAVILAQSKKGVIGESIDILPVVHSDSPVRLTLIKGLHTSSGFKKMKVLKKTKGKGPQFIRYGQYY